MHRGNFRELHYVPSALYRTAINIDNCCVCRGAILSYFYYYSLFCQSAIRPSTVSAPYENNHAWGCYAIHAMFDGARWCYLLACKVMVTIDRTHINAPDNFCITHVIMSTTYQYSSNSGCGEREAQTNWSMVIPEKAAPVTRNALRTTGSVPADTRQ